MIFLRREEWRVGSPPRLERAARGAFYQYKCRTMPAHRRNLKSAWCVEYSPDKAQVKLESRLTGRRANLAGCILTLGQAISQIPILEGDRKSTRLNSSHSQISYAVFCLKKKTHRRHAIRLSWLIGTSRQSHSVPHNVPY